MSTAQTIPVSRDAFVPWQQQSRLRLAAALMNGRLPERVPPAVETLGEEVYPPFTLRRIRYRSQPDRTTTALVSLPKNARSAPVLLAIHGHEATWGEADAGAFRAGHNDDFCAYFAEHGWIVIQPATMNHTLQHAGWTLQGEWTWDVLVALDYALALPEADPNRVAVCGLSTGGHLAMNVLALDSRVKAGVVGCVLSTWHHYETRMIIPPHCDCGIRAQLQPHFEQHQWAALAAPKPVQYQHGRQDACFCPAADPKFLLPDWNRAVMPQAEYDAMFAEVQRAYQLARAPDHVETSIHNGPHKVDNALALTFLNKYAKLP